MDKKSKSNVNQVENNLLRKQLMNEDASSTNDQICCTRLALSVYKKAWEGTKKDISRTNHSLDNQYLPSIHANLDDLESDQMTEKSFDYIENALTSESVFEIHPLKFSTHVESPSSISELKQLDNITLELKKFIQELDNFENNDSDTIKKNDQILNLNKIEKNLVKKDSKLQTLKQKDLFNFGPPKIDMSPLNDIVSDLINQNQSTQTSSLKEIEKGLRKVEAKQRIHNLNEPSKVNKTLIHESINFDLFKTNNLTPSLSSKTFENTLDKKLNENLSLNQKFEDESLIEVEPFGIEIFKVESTKIENFKNECLDKNLVKEKNTQLEKSLNQHVIKNCNQEMKSVLHETEDKKLSKKVVKENSEPKHAIESGDGIFKFNSSQPILNRSDSEVSTNELSSISLSIPTLVISEDELDDSSLILSIGTFCEQSSEDETFHDFENEIIKSTYPVKSNKIKNKMKKLSGKIKHIFKKSEPANDIKNEDLKRKALELEKRENELIKREEEQQRKENQKLTNEEKQLQENEIKKLQNLDIYIEKEAAIKKKEEELKKKEEKLKNLEEEILIESEEKSKKMEKEIKKRIDEEIAKLEDTAKANVLNSSFQSKLSLDDQIQLHTIFSEHDAKKANQQSKINVVKVEDNDIKNFPSDFGKLKPSFEEKELAIQSSPILDSSKTNSSQKQLIEVSSLSTSALAEPFSDTLLIKKPLSQSVSNDISKSCKNYQTSFPIESEDEAENEVCDERKRKRLRKKLYSTKNRFKNFKSRALDSLPTMSSIKSKVKVLLPNKNQKSSEYVEQRRPREQQTFDEYRKRYPDSELDLLSDSELVESRKNKIHHLYENMNVDEKISQAFFNQSSFGLPRPPRRSEFQNFRNFTTVKSEPNISKKSISLNRKLKATPPSRPPPVSFYKPYFSNNDHLNNQFINFEQSSQFQSFNESLKNSHLPAETVYKTICKEWKAKNQIRVANMLSQSSPNLVTQNKQLNLIKMTPFHPESYQTFNFETSSQSQVLNHTCLNYKPSLTVEGLPPLPPPRAQKSCPTSRSSSFVRKEIEPSIQCQTFNYLSWKPFSWKTGKCRSWAEFDIPNKNQVNVHSNLNFNSLNQQLYDSSILPTIAPPSRPPLPNLDQLKPIYSTAVKTKKNHKFSSPPPFREIVYDNKLQAEPLSAPPLPPRRRKVAKLHLADTSCDQIESSVSTQLCLQTLHTLASRKDASVSTKDNGLIKVNDKQVQTYIEDFNDIPPGEPPCRKKFYLPLMPEDLDPNSMDAMFSNYKTITNQNFNNTPGLQRVLSENASITSSQTNGSYHDALDYVYDLDMEGLTDVEINNENENAKFFNSNQNKTTPSSTNFPPPSNPLSPPNLSTIDQEDDNLYNNPQDDLSLTSANCNKRDDFIQFDEDSEDDMLNPTRSTYNEIRSCIQRRILTDDMNISD